MWFKSFLCLIPVFLISGSASASVTELRLHGYSLIPAPQEVRLRGQDIVLDPGWGVVATEEEARFARDWLTRWTEELHGISLTGTGGQRIHLKLDSKSVLDPQKSAQRDQAYRLTMSADGIEISGNDTAGLFYGVQSLLQIMRRVGVRSIKVPAGTIVDWPSLPLRIVHWDTKHHQSRISTLKRYLDWAALFKINAISFEMEDKYEYPSHPLVGAPGAYTQAEMRDLTRYALQRHIQLIPNVQAPAHMTYVLKHEKYAHLRSDGSNYLACMCDEEAMQLIFDLYQDMIDATPGVEYFHVSTDEVYYAGICEKCSDEYNVENRSQLWVDYVNRVYAWMQERNRQVMCWVEYPLLVEHMAQLPEGLIDAITVPGRGREWIAAENAAGIYQIAYTSMQGSEYLFPNLFPTRYRGRFTNGRVRDARNTVALVREEGAENLIGTFVASWDDAGLHDEVFWLGWAAVTQYGWSKERPSAEQTVADFLDTYYGPGNSDIYDLYLALQKGARFFEDLWDREVSKERDTGYGNSRGKGVGGGRTDILLKMPALPGEPTTSFRERYAAKIEEARSLKPHLDLLIQGLTSKLTEVTRNRYNLEVLLSIAALQRFTQESVIDLARADDYLLQAEKLRAADPSRAVRQMVEAYNLVGGILKRQETMWQYLTSVWEKSRFPKNRAVNGREFVWVMDDVKDHFADRRRGLDYMLAPFQRMEMPVWQDELLRRIKSFAQENGVPVEGVPEERLED